MYAELFLYHNECVIGLGVGAVQLSIKTARIDPFDFCLNTPRDRALITF